MKLTKAILAMGVVVLAAVGCDRNRDDGSVVGTETSDSATSSSDSTMTGQAPSIGTDTPQEDVAVDRDTESATSTAPSADIGKDTSAMSDSKKKKSAAKKSGKSGAAAQTSFGNYREGHEFAVIDFKPGTAVLTDSAKEELRAIVRDANAAGIEDVHVAAWSDKAFPSSGKDLSKVDRDLADKRIETINSYMKDTLEVADVDTYNMAEKSNWFARAFNTNDAEVKSLMTEQDAPKNIEPQELTIVQKRGGPMRAVILVEPLEDMARTSSGTSSGTTVVAPVVVEETYTEETTVEPNPAPGLSRTDDIHSQPVAGADDDVDDEDDRGTESAATLPRQPKEEFIAPTLDDYGTQQDPIRKDGTELFERPSTNLSD